MGKGGVLALFRMCSLAATSSISPLANSGFAFWRLTILPSTATTNSLRACSALACVAAFVLGAQFAAVVRALQVAEKIQHVVLFRWLRLSVCALSFLSAKFRCSA